MQIVLLDHWSISTSHFVCVTTIPTIELAADDQQTM